ncbi:MAG: hypothetical protein JWQ09_2585 [Segetibacter sp.]|nr:hypothetical protein [Segetibacter sp.]
MNFRLPCGTFFKSSTIGNTCSWGAINFQFMRFSQRIGKKQSKVDIQLDSMDAELQNGLWNILRFTFLDDLGSQQWTSNTNYESFIKSIWFSFFKEPIDKIPDSTYGLISELRERFFSWDYLEVYDFIDFIARIDESSIDNETFVEACNLILKRELSGYRFVSGELVPITNEGEILEIEKAISASAENNLKGVSIHLTEALRKLSDRKNPDYRNSIKEAISAVESICQQITNDPKAELGKALKRLKTSLNIHGALEQGFVKIYGYTSDGDGIRHAIMDETNLDQEDALYMLISCSAFINYLIAKANKAGLEIT